jgi:hypothetical protein
MTRNDVIGLFTNASQLEDLMKGKSHAGDSKGGLFYTRAG